MNLATEYLGLQLPHPFIAGAGTLKDDIDSAKMLEDAGAAAIVTRSLFEEQVINNPLARPENVGMTEAGEQFLKHIRQAKSAVDIPIIASYNGFDTSGMAQSIVQAGADAIELNVYYVGADPNLTAAEIEQWGLDMLTEVSSAAQVPISVKLSPFYTSLANYASNLVDRGASGLVLLNRYFETDIDIELSEVSPSLQLSDSRELLLRLRWLSILSTCLPSTSLAVTGGVHSAADAIKAIMSGASAVQLVSAILKHGPEQLTTLRAQLEDWIGERGIDSLQALHKSIDVFHSREAYMRLLQTWQWS